MGCGNSNSLKEKNIHYNNLNKLKKSEIKPIRQSYKKVSYKDITILDNVQKYIPENTTRDEIKFMVYNALGITDLKNKSNNNLTEEQIDAIIDILVNTINGDNKKIDDNRLKGIKAVIGFYDADKENVKQLFFKNKKPTEEEIEDKLNDLVSVSDETKLFAIEINN